MDCDFCSQKVTPLLSHGCEVVYDRFLLEASIPIWGLTILGQKVPAVMVSATDPDGSITLTMDTQKEIHDLLLRSYDEWRAHEAAAKKKAVGKNRA